MGMGKMENEVTLQEYGSTTLPTLSSRLASTGLNWYSMGIKKNEVLGSDKKSQDLYWNHLFSLGWKLNIIPANSYGGGVVQVIYPCSKCDLPLDTQMLHILKGHPHCKELTKAYAQELVGKHKKAKRCKPKEYLDE